MDAAGVVVGDEGEDEDDEETGSGEIGRAGFSAGLQLNLNTA